jgi:CRISPR/Cas system CMR-associated protein Cmr1 (group 7 of RAMP superfamily)
MNIFPPPREMLELRLEVITQRIGEHADAIEKHQEAAERLVQWIEKLKAEEKEIRKVLKEGLLPI